MAARPGSSTAAAAHSKDVVSARAAPAARPREHDFALVVGVDHYPRFRSLEGAVADATSFHAWAIDPSGGGVDPARAKLVVSSPEPAAPIQDQIDEQLVELLAAADQLGGGRRLYFYFSGHGASCDGATDQQDIALLVANWSERLARFAMSARQYSDQLRGGMLFEEVVIFADCCRSAAVGAIGRPPGIAFQRQSEPLPTRTFIAYATEAGGRAFERPEDARWQGVFTRELLALLRGTPGGLTAAELKDRLEQEVTLAAAGQQAEVSNNLLGAGRFGGGTEPPVLQVEFATVRGHVQLLDYRGAPIDEHDAAAGPWSRPTPSGLYKLVSDLGEVLLIDHTRAGGSHVRF